MAALCKSGLSSAHGPVGKVLRAGRELVYQRMNYTEMPPTAHPARPLPVCVETELREHLMAKVGQMRVAPMAGIRPRVRDFRLDARRALAQHDYAAGKEQRLFHIMGHEQRGEAGALPQ